MTIRMHTTARVGALIALALLAAPALAQDGPAGAGGRTSLWGLFVQSFDLFSVVLIAGSLAAVAIMARAIMDIRESKIIPQPSIDTLATLAAAGRLQELREFAARDASFPARVVLAAVDRAPSGKAAMREAAEMSASEECARWFRAIEPLNVIGNLGPLVGLAGTVWGMILAFTSLGQAGGQANPADLSLGISKALFHTLLGLCLATPCLLVFGFYRSRVDKLCTRAMAISADLVDKLPESPR